MNFGPILYIYIYYIISRRSITPQHIKYNSKSLDVVQSLFFGSNDEGSLLPKCRDCTTSNDFELYIYIYIILIYIYYVIIYIYINIIYIYNIYNSKSLNVVQSLYFGSKLPSSLLPKYVKMLLYKYIYNQCNIIYIYYII